MYVHTTALSLLAPPFFLIILGTFSSPFTFLFDAERRTRVLVVLPSASYCPPHCSYSLSHDPLHRPTTASSSGSPSLSCCHYGGRRTAPRRWWRRRRGEMLLAPERRGKREGEKGAFPRLSSGLSGKGGELPFHYIPSPLTPPPKPFPFLLYRLLSLSVRPLSLLPAPLRPRNRRRRRCSPPPSIPWPNLGTFLLGRLLQGKSVRDSPVTYEEGAGKDTFTQGKRFESTD